MSDKNKKPTKRQVVAVRFNDETGNELARVSKETGLSVADIVRIGAKTALENFERDGALTVKAG